MASAERETSESSLRLKPGESFRPFEGFPPLEHFQFFQSRNLFLDGVGMGHVSIDQVDENDLSLFVNFIKKKGGRVISPYGIIAVHYLINPDEIIQVKSLTPSELMLSFDLPVMRCPPTCIFELPSTNQSFIGVPLPQPDEELWSYTWKIREEEENETIVLLPNEKRVLEELTLCFIK
ncbi:MAG TPA: hypothetical protein VMY36_03125 [Patescibacteria group bacterium]|nr:hypothetical protein [Patescibacteria group bacterium]HUW24743.1 hypothetical protein [Patescibacteria group bacterium]